MVMRGMGVMVEEVVVVVVAELDIITGVTMEMGVGITPD